MNFTDVLARRGAPGYASEWPFVPGMEVAGAIEGPLGEGVEGLAPGDSVVAFTPDGGAFAEYVLADAQLATGVPAGLDPATATIIPLTWATALGLARRAHVAPGDKVLVTSAAGGVGTALAAVLARHGAGLVVGGIGSPAKAEALAPGYVPVVRDAGFFANATAAAGSGFDVILDSLGGTLLAESASNLAIGGRLVSYGGAAGQPDPATPGFGDLRATNKTVSGFSILRLARTAPQHVRTLIHDVMHLARNGLVVTPPTVVGWDNLIDAHLRQSEGTAVGKTVVALS
ncbi:quinone oxidoreductase family protein [Pseudarthrobacter sp. H2]|uniref:quinone oxidoreductase family protein n=1 Tax=Pseudarthrobacter sp. H2 TaxID=3418415 RepID=UPI003CFB0D7A